RARLGDSEWMAVSSDKKVIPEGAVVIVDDIDGARLIVTYDPEKQTIN
ncbi:MAG: NfeD family protein, partial [Ruminococcus sp.]